MWPKSYSTAALSISEQSHFEEVFTSNFDLQSIEYLLDQHKNHSENIYSLRDIYQCLNILLLQKGEGIAQEQARKTVLTEILKDVTYLSVLLTKDNEIKAPADQLLVLEDCEMQDTGKYHL